MEIRSIQVEIWGCWLVVKDLMVSLARLGCRSAGQVRSLQYGVPTLPRSQLSLQVLGYNAGLGN